MVGLTDVDLYAKRRYGMSETCRRAVRNWHTAMGSYLHYRPICLLLPSPYSQRCSVSGIMPLYFSFMSKCTSKGLLRIRRPARFMGNTAVERDTKLDNVCLIGTS